MIGYWAVIAPAAVASMGAVVLLSHRLARQAGHVPPRLEVRANLASMILAEEQAIGREPGYLGTWFPHADPWEIPGPGPWTDDLLEELREAPSVLDGIEPGRQLGAAQLEDLAADPDQLVVLAAEVARCKLHLDDQAAAFVAALGGHV
jgi:hypothetical protein